MKKISLNHRVCRTLRKPTDVIVEPGLSISPAEMRRLNERGIAVSTQNAGNVFETGRDAATWDIAPENRRNVDPAELWEIQQSARKRLKSVKTTLKAQ